MMSLVSGGMLNLFMYDSVSPEVFDSENESDVKLTVELLCSSAKIEASRDSPHSTGIICSNWCAVSGFE